nr:MAG TPA: hypothetical protein [Caudoviricetes sp.]
MLLYHSTDTKPPRPFLSCDFKFGDLHFSDYKRVSRF